MPDPIFTVMVEAVNERGERIPNLGAHFEFRPQAIIERLGLRRPIFAATAAYGHFGRNEFPSAEIVVL